MKKSHFNIFRKNREQTKILASLLRQNIFSVNLIDLTVAFIEFADSWLQLEMHALDQHPWIFYLLRVKL